MNMSQMIPLFLDYCRSKQLRPKTMQSYEQSLRLFTGWLEEEVDVQKVSELKEVTSRCDILKLQSRRKYATAETIFGICTSFFHSQIPFGLHSNPRYHRRNPGRPCINITVPATVNRIAKKQSLGFHIQKNSGIRRSRNLIFV